MTQSNHGVPPVILVVDNDSNSLDIYKIILQKEGFAVFEADDLDTAQRQAVSVAVNLILIELRLPRLEGFEICRRLKATPDTCNLPIVFISGAADQPIIEQAYALGAVDFILKPCRSHHLVARLREHLRP